MKRGISLTIGIGLILLLVQVFHCVATGTEEQGIQEAGPVPISILMDSGSRVWAPEKNNALIMLQENTNTALTVEMSDDLTTTVNLRVASGDIPDLMETAEMTFLEYLNTGYFMELTDLLDEYGPNVKHYIREDAWEVTKVGREIYVIPHANNNCKYVVPIRSDWLKNLGITLSGDTYLGDYGTSVTLDEFVDIMNAFTYDDPDQDGRDDTYGYSKYSGDHRRFFMPFYGAFGGQVGQYYDYDGAVLPFEVTDDYRAALEFLADVWSQGVIDPELFLLNTDQGKQKLMNGVSGCFVGWWSHAHQLWMDGMLEIDPDTEWANIYVTNNDGTVTGMLDNGIVDHCWFISAESKRPDAVMSLLDYCTTDEGFYLVRWGVEGEHYTLDDQGYLTRTELGSEYFTSWILDPAYRLGFRLDEENFQNLAPVADDAPAYLKLRLHSNHVVLENTAPLYTSLFYGQPITTEDTEYGNDVLTYVDQMAMEFVTGTTQLNDGTWEDYLNRWEKMGGADVLQSYVDQYNAMYGTSYVAGIR